MRIFEILNEKKMYIDLLLLGDEQEDMIDKYLERGRLFVLEDMGVKAICAVTDEGKGVLEIKNIAVREDSQRQGYGRNLIEFLRAKFKGDFKILQAGTGNSPLTVPFYEKCGFKKSHTVKNFFTDNYDHPIFEGGVQLKDMVYFRLYL